jgi:hypothetical protein
MSAMGAMTAAPRIPNRKGESVGASGAGGLKTCNTTTTVFVKYIARRGKDSYKVEPLNEPVE